jgi:hypothetical protein
MALALLLENTPLPSVAILLILTSTRKSNARKGLRIVRREKLSKAAEHVSRDITVSVADEFVGTLKCHWMHATCPSMVPCEDGTYAVDCNTIADQYL